MKLMRWKNFMQQVVKKVKVPLMIDSTYDHIIELGLKYSQGKAIINSINLEDGETKFEGILPLNSSLWRCGCLYFD